MRERMVLWVLRVLVVALVFSLPTAAWAALPAVATTHTFSALPEFGAEEAQQADAGRDEVVVAEAGCFKYDEQDALRRKTPELQEANGFAAGQGFVPEARGPPRARGGPGVLLERPPLVRPDAVGIAPKVGHTLAQRLRSQLGLAPGQRNVALAHVNIEGRGSQLLKAVSGRKSPAGTVGAPAPGTRRFRFRKSGAMTRAMDTEAKILEDVASGLHSNATGTVRLYTERAACFSCRGIIQQFEEAFPGVRVVVTSGK